MLRLKRLLVFIFGLAVLALPLLLWWQWNAIYDWAKLRGYSPPATVAVLVGQDSMTAYAQHMFYVNHPAVVSQPSQFRIDCNEDEKTIILGCYHPVQSGIYIYNVQDSRLNGIQQVTAAHEMLHAAYGRLSTKDRDYVDGLLQDYYTKDLHDQRIIDTINAYRLSEPGDVVNEMHSVFGTEIANLPTPLETYYKKYFTNRQTVTTFAAAYQSEFTGRENQIKADDAQLSSLKTQIDSEEQSLTQQLNQINNDRARLDAERSSGQISVYNSSVDSFNGEVNAYNSGIDRLHSDIATYNNLVNTRNQIAKDLGSLDQAIDTRLTAQSKQ